MTDAREIVPRYIVHTTKIRDLVVDFEIELVEGRYTTEEVYTSHKFDITEFVESAATGDRRSPRTWDPYNVHETRDEAETWVSMHLDRTRRIALDILEHLDEGRDRRRVRDMRGVTT